MARRCELCKKKVGINDSCYPPYFVKQIQPYGNIFKSVTAPGSMSAFTCDSFLCVDCLRMAEYLFAYKWSGKQDSATHAGINNSDKCTNEEIYRAQEYIKSRLNSATDQRYIKFFVDALAISQQIIQRRNTFSTIKTEQKVKIQEYIENRIKQIDDILQEFTLSSMDDDNASFGLINDCLVICYDMNLIREKVSAQSTLNNVIQIIDTSNPVDNIEELVQNGLERHNKEIVVYRYPLADILYFKVEDNRQYVSNVHGGGGSGGGANLSGAVVGGALFGGAGAIVGSQLGTEIKINPIKTEIKEVGKRTTTLFCKNDNEIRSIDIPVASAPEALSTLIPQKSYDYVMLHENIGNNVESAAKPINSEKAEPNTSTRIGNIAEEIRQLKSLLDEGILTQEEFDKKKKELLSL